MYTLKIHWERCLAKGNRPYETVDESTLFIPADEVQVHAHVTDDDQLNAWPEGSYLDYRVVLAKESEDGTTGETTHMSGRMIQVDRRNEPSKWYLATHAWLLGPDGKTIERLT